MAGLKADIESVTSRLDTEAPDVMAHLRSHGLGDLTLFCPKWYLCLFINTLPEEVLLRVWDNIILRDGDWEEALFAVTVQLFRASSGVVLAAEGLSEIFEVMRGIGETVWDVSGFLQGCFAEAAAVCAAAATPDLEQRPVMRKRRGSFGPAGERDGTLSPGGVGATPPSGKRRRRSREEEVERGGAVVHAAAQITPPSAKRPRRVALAVSTAANSPGPSGRGGGTGGAKEEPATPKVPLTPMSRSLWRNVVQAVTPSKKKARPGSGQRFSPAGRRRLQRGRSLLGQALGAVMEAPTSRPRGAEGEALGREAAALVSDWLELAHMDSPVFPRPRLDKRVD